MILFVNRDQILHYWPEVQPLVESALEHSQGEFDPTDILGYLIAQSMQLWVSIDGQVNGMAVTQICTFPRYRAAHVVLLSGKDAVGGWFAEMIRAIEIWAKAVGCTRVTENGRPGWEKLEERLHLGYKKTYITMSKPI